MRMLALSLVVLTSSACHSGPLAPDCSRRTGSVLNDTAGAAPAGSAVSYQVTSPVDSNLVISVTWNNPNTHLGLSATILACGGHAGCQVGLTSTASRTQPMILELVVDGTRGKQYRIDVVGDPSQDQAFTVRVMYDTGGCT